MRETKLDNALKEQPGRILKTVTAGKGKDVRLVDVLEPPPPRPLIEPPPRPWPCDRGPAEMTAWVNTAVWHYIAIRATGSVPNPGGPSAPLQIPTSHEGFISALAIAENYWPQARQFDLIGSDLEYIQKMETENLQPGMNRLRDAVTITTFAVTDRGAVLTPAAVLEATTAAQQAAAAKAAEAESQPAGAAEPAIRSTSRRGPRPRPAEKAGPGHRQKAR
jgi:hypothetical protein